jgi:hypothetical protein
MITPSSSSLPQEPPLPSKLPSMDAHALSLGSKLAAHFTPLRSPSRNGKARYSMIQKPIAPTPPPVPSPTALSPPVPGVRAPSIESQHSSISRSTTPRPLRGPHSSAAENGDEEDFSDLFTLPNQFKKPQQSPKSPSTTSVHLYLGDSPKKSGEITPVTPVTPLGPPLQFPIPPSTIIPPRSILTDKSLPRYSSELASLSSQRSRSPSKRPSPVRVDSGRTLHSDFSSQDERQGSHYRTTSISGSDTDTSRASYSSRSFRLAPVVPKPSSMKSKLSASSTTKASSGPPPSVPLPSPPLSSAGLGPRSAPSTSPNRVAFPRPRANTLSVTSNLVVPGQALPKSNHSSPPRSSRANSDATPDVTVDEMREALSQQRRKNAQLQEYIFTITKRYEDDRMAMTKNIEKLERTIRKKMREIEGLRWLVIHNGAVSDIDAAANLARSSFSTQDGDALDDVRGPSPLPSPPVAAPHHHGPPSHQSISGQQGASITVTAATSGPELNTSSSAASFSTSSVSETNSLSTSSLSVIPERRDGISRAERQRLKEERRASKALRRISAASTLALGTDHLTQSPADSPLTPNFDPKQSMDEVFEKLQPFRHA